MIVERTHKSPDKRQDADCQCHVETPVDPVESSVLVFGVEV